MLLDSWNLLTNFFLILGLSSIKIPKCLDQLKGKREEKRFGRLWVTNNVILSSKAKQPENYFIQFNQVIHQNHCSQDLYYTYTEGDAA